MEEPTGDRTLTVASSAAGRRDHRANHLSEDLKHEPAPASLMRP